MSIKSNVAAVLRAFPVNRINFRINNILINKAQMDKVAKEIEKENIKIEIGGSGPNFSASYTSWKTRRFKPGEKKLIGKMTISQQAIKTVIEKSAIFHESVHALMDVSNYKPPPPINLNHEVFAYLADALYLALENRTAPKNVEVGDIYIEAYGIILSKKMLKKSGVILKWTDCDALRKAIKVTSGYN
ncbi:MAG: hypothetical protein ACYSTS_15320 [Planctomycetota bacterium]|jgi:hypothetical protein